MNHNMPRKDEWEALAQSLAPHLTPTLKQVAEHLAAEFDTTSIARMNPRATDAEVRRLVSTEGVLYEALRYILGLWIDRADRQRKIEAL